MRENIVNNLKLFVCVCVVRLMGNVECPASKLLTNVDFFPLTFGIRVKSSVGAVSETSRVVECACNKYLKYYTFCLVSITHSAVAFHAQNWMQINWQLPTQKCIIYLIECTPDYWFDVYFGTYGTYGTWSKPTLSIRMTFLCVFILVCNKYARISLTTKLNVASNGLVRRTIRI